MDLKIAKCKACGADIVWAKTIAGKNMPLDAKPITQWVVSQAGQRPFSDHTEWMAEPIFVRTPHWQMCPHADKFRRVKHGK